MSVDSSPPKWPKAREQVLVCDADADARRALVKILLSQGLEVLSAGDADAMRSMLRTAKIDLLFFDLGLTSGKIPGGVRELLAEHPGLLLIALCRLDDSGQKLAGELPGEVFALIAKPLVSEAQVIPLVRQALARKALLRRSLDLEERLAQHEAWGSVIGNSKLLKDAHKLALAAAQSDKNVLITGEPGTGKELFARLVHRHGRRAGQELLVLRCDAMPQDVLEKTLFGEAEALSAAMPGEAGMWAAAEQGTLLLDEVSALSPALQERLLRAILGFEDVQRMRRRDVRIIATSSADLSARPAEGRFHEELRTRLEQVRIVLPPLRKRKDDVPLYAYFFAQQAARSSGRSIRRIGVEALRLLRSYAWPGNVRELKETMEQAVLMTHSDIIVPGDLPLQAVDEGVSALPAPRSMAGGLELSYAKAKDLALASFERSYVEALMAETGENVSEAAKRAGMDRSNFRRILKRVRGKSG